MTLGAIKTINGQLYETKADSQSNEIWAKLNRPAPKEVYSFKGVGAAADDTEFAKIVTAVNATSGAVIEITGDVHLTTTHTITAPVELRGTPGAKLTIAATAGRIIFNRVADPWDSPTLTELAIDPVTAGQSFIGGTAALGLVQGDYVAVFSDDEITDVGRNSNPNTLASLEIHRIIKPVRSGGTYSTTDFEIDGFLWDSMSTSSVVVELPMVKGVVIRDLTIAHSGSSAGQSPLRFGMVAGARVVNCVFDSPATGELDFWYCHDVQVHGCSFREKYDPDDSALLSGQGYGIVLVNCTLVDIAHNAFGFMRHAVTTGSSIDGTIEYGMIRDAVIRNNLINVANSVSSGDVVASHPALDTHASGCNVIFEGNTFQLQAKAGANSTAIVNRSRSTIIRNNDFFLGDSNVNQPIATYGPDAVIEGNSFQNVSDAIRVGDIGTTNANTDGTIVRRNTIVGSSDTGIWFNFGDNHIAEDNIFKGTFTNSQIKVSAGTGHKFRRNYMPGDNATRSVHLSGVTSTAVSEFSGNTVTNYNNGGMGFDRTVDGEVELESTWRSRNIVDPGVTHTISNSLSIATDTHTPITYSGAIVDDAADTEYIGLLKDRDASEICVIPPGDEFLLSHGWLLASEPSFAPGTTDRLYFDASGTRQGGGTGAYSYTEPANSIMGPALMVIGETGTQPTGKLRCIVLAQPESEFKNPNMVAAPASDATPGVFEVDVIKATAGATTWTITDFDGGAGIVYSGQVLQVLIDNSGTGAVTISHGSGINLDNGTSFTPSNKASLSLVYDGTDWNETGRARY